MSFTSWVRRDLAIAITARSVSLLGNEAAVIALALRLTNNGAAPWAVAALLIAGLAPIVVLAPVAGRLVDSIDSRRLLVVAGSSQALLCTGLAFATNTAAIFALVAALGAFEAVTGSTWQALLPSLTEPDNLPRALGLSQAGATASVIVAPVLGGLLTGWFSPTVPLLLDAVTFAAVAVGGLVVRTRRVPSRADAAQQGGFGVLRADPVLAILAAMLGLFVVLGAMVNVVDVFLVRSTLHASSSWFGVIGGLWGVGLLVGSLLGGRAKGQTALARLMIGSAVLLAVAIGAYAGAPQVYWLILPALVGGVANGALNLAIMSLVMGRAPASARGRVSAAITGLASGGMIGAYVLGGSLASFLTPREIFALAGVLGLLAPVCLGRRLLRASAPVGAVPEVAIA